MATDKESAAKVDLGLLEEDDEFEEFPADGVCHNRKIPLQICSYFFLGNIVSNTCKYSHERGAVSLITKSCTQTKSISMIPFSLRCRVEGCGGHYSECLGGQLG